MRERQDYRRAEQMIKKALELSPDNSVFEQNLRMVIQKQALKQAR
jgi:Flp pilus assembly protein TadD